MTNLNTPAAQRLNSLKQKAEKWNNDTRRYSTVDWREIRTWTHRPGYHKYLTGKLNRVNDKIYVDHLDNFAQGDWQDADGCARLGHSDWYTDNFQGGLLKPAVLTVRAKKRMDEDGAHFVYMPATYHTDWEGATVYNEFYDNKVDAANAADGFAEHDSEICREDDAIYQAEQQIEALKEELHDLNKETLAVIKEAKASYKVGYDSAVFKLIKRSIKEAVERRTEIFEELERLVDTPWLSV